MDVPQSGEPTFDRPEPPGQAVMATGPYPPPGVPGPPETATGQRKRGWIYWLAGLVVLVGAAVTGWFVLQSNADNSNATAPVDAVRTYVDAIARGDATTANDLVDPKTLAKDVDPALLTDKMLDSADERISILDVRKGKSSGDTVEVVVKFRVMAEKLVEGGDMRDLPREAADDSVTLRVTRTDTDVFGFETWEVRDPFLVPVAVMAGGAPVDTATLGSESVKVNDLSVPAELDPVFVYPALYPVRGPEFSQHLEQTAGRQGLAPFGGERPTEETEPTAAMLMYMPTDKLSDTVSAKIAEHVKACQTTSPFPPNCPSTLEESGGLTVRITENPTLDDLLPHPTKPYAEGKPIELTFTASGKVSLTSIALPEPLDLPLIIMGQVTIKPDDSVTVTFTDPVAGP
jgi:hypothetical protein